MKERPILFSAAMVQAILAGRKTQTRRLVKKIEKVPPYYLGWQHNGFAFFRDHLGVSEFCPFVCPYGAPGDRLWVRETWQQLHHNDAGETVYIKSPKHASQSGLHTMFYRADGDQISKEAKWQPSIFMPRWASRLTLEITGVRVERLQDISDGDAISEGIERIGGKYSFEPWKNYTKGRSCSAPSRSFKTLWESINGPESWAANPYVWVVEFRKVESCSSK